MNRKRLIWLRDETLSMTDLRTLLNACTCPRWAEHNIIKYWEDYASWENWYGTSVWQETITSETLYNLDLFYGIHNWRILSLWGWVTWRLPLWMVTKDVMTTQLILHGKICSYITAKGKWENERANDTSTIICRYKVQYIAWDKIVPKSSSIS